MSNAERVRKLFKENHGVDEGTILPETTIESLGLDSMDRIEFMFLLEDEFRIKIPEDIQNPSTVQDILDLVDRLVGGDHETQGA